MRVFLTFRKLCVSTDFGPGPNTFCHPSDVDTDEWFRVRFTRLVLAAYNVISVAREKCLTVQLYTTSHFHCFLVL